MRKLSKCLVMMAVSALLLVMMAASAFAEGNGTGVVDFETGTVTAKGFGVAPPNAINAGQARILARRAAVVDGYRQLVEAIKGVNVTGDTTVEMSYVTSDVVKTHIDAMVQGAQVVSEQRDPDGVYEVTMKVSLYGVSNSVASAVMPKPEVQEAFPQPVADVAPSTPTQSSVSVSVSVNQQIPATTSSVPATQPAAPKGSSAAAAPAGKAIGGYTGLIIDCRGLGLKAVMSPVIKNADGQSIYGYKNLDYNRVVSEGMAGYTSDISRAARAGANPLVVKAVSVDGHNGNPVLSVADANRVLIENGATGFLDNMNVVFVR